jgi:hypothetical protein
LRISLVARRQATLRCKGVANQVPTNKLSLHDGGGHTGDLPVQPRVTTMSIHNSIDQIVETFIPEMERISKMNESAEQKERHYKAWIRATLQKFADDVRDIETRNKTKDSRGNDAA